MNSLVSIIVPVYNVEKYIHRCIRSIITQTYRNLEILLVDDGSSDNSGKICDDYSLIDSRIQVIHKENAGLSSARNIGIDKSKGDFLAFVDSDDYIERNMIWDMMQKFISVDVDMVACGYNVVSANGEVVCKKNIREAKKVPGEILVRDILLDKFPYSFAWNKIYRKSLFVDVRYPEGRYYEDISVTYRLAYKSRLIYLINNSYYNYFLYRNGNTTSELASKKAAFSYYCALLNSFEIKHFINDNPIYSDLGYVVSKDIKIWTKETLRNSVKVGYNNYQKYKDLLYMLYNTNGLNISLVSNAGMLFYFRERCKYSIKKIIKKILKRR